MSANSSSLSRQHICDLVDAPMKELNLPSKQIAGNKLISCTKLCDCSRLTSNFGWPTMEEFTSTRGAEAIHLFIKSWNLTCGWLYKLTELPTKESRFWVDYCYEARFGIPTRRQPIPKHTVSVFFTLRKAYCKPKDAKIEVTFAIESLRQKHEPDKCVFNEEWLKMILESKANLGEKLCF
nr:A kinase anchor protein 14 [Hymenolepis microstoma]